MVDVIDPFHVTGAKSAGFNPIDASGASHYDLPGQADRQPGRPRGRGAAYTASL